MSNPMNSDELEELQQDESPLGPEGCCFPGKCCMPGPHYESECHTPEMLLAQEAALTPPTPQPACNYDAATPETDAFMLLINDSEVDLRMVESKLKDLECERNAARIDAASWKMAALKCGLYRGDADVSTAEMWQTQQVNASVALLADRDGWKAHAARSDKELCELQDSLGCPAELRLVECDRCDWHGTTRDATLPGECPKEDCMGKLIDGGVADAQAAAMERIRDLIVKESELTKECVDHAQTQADFMCCECGSTGPFSDVVYPSSPDHAEEHDIQCDGCGSLDVAESASTAFQASSRRWLKELEKIEGERDALRAQVAAKDAALRLMVDVQGVAHDSDECPQDDTCKCQLPAIVNAALALPATP